MRPAASTSGHHRLARTAGQLVAAGALPIVHVGGCRRIPADGLAAYFASLPRARPAATPHVACVPMASATVPPDGAA